MCLPEKKYFFFKTDKNMEIELGMCQIEQALKKAYYRTDATDGYEKTG